MVGLQDAVLDWGGRRPTPITSYDDAKRQLVNGRSNDEIIDAAGGNLTWNEAMISLASVPPVLSQDAVLWLDAEYSASGEQSVVNQGTGGSALDARYGSTTGSDTNDPLLLTHTGENYAYLPGAAANDVYIDASQAATYTVNGDFDIRLFCDVPTPGIQYSLISCCNDTSGYELSLTNSRAIQFYFRAAGAGAASAPVSTASVPTGPIWIRVTRPKTSGLVTFYTSTDGDTWTQLGATTVVEATRAIQAPTIRLGHSRNAVQSTAGKMFRVVVMDDGATVVDIDYDADITSSSATSFTATSGQTVTVNRATSGRKTALVTRPIWLFGTDDYLEVADNALLDFGAADDFTVMTVRRQWATISGSQPSVLAKGGAWPAVTPAGWTHNDGRSLSMADGSVLVESDYRVPTSGQLFTSIGARDVAADKLKSWINGVALAEVTDTTTGSLSNSEPLRVGRNSISYLDMEILTVAVWDRVLTTDEIAEINTFYGTA